MLVQSIFINIQSVTLPDTSHPLKAPGYIFSISFIMILNLPASALWIYWHMNELPKCNRDNIIKFIKECESPGKDMLGYTNTDITKISRVGATIAQKLDIKIII